MLFANGIPDNIQANLAMLGELGGTKTYPSVTGADSSRIRGRGLGKAGRGALAARRSDVGDED
jgi:hypothetical protein